MKERTKKPLILGGATKLNLPNVLKMKLGERLGFDPFLALYDKGQLNMLPRKAFKGGTARVGSAAQARTANFNSSLKKVPEK